MSLKSTIPEKSLEANFMDDGRKGNGLGGTDNNFGPADDVNLMKLGKKNKAKTRVKTASTTVFC